MPRLPPVALALVCIACSYDQIDHAGGTTGVAPGLSATITSFGETGSGPVSNFPDPASSICGELPPGHTPIDDLASAWVVAAVPDAVDGYGAPVAPGTMRLRLTDRPLPDCGAAFFDSPADGADEIPLPWGLGLSFAEDELALGTMELDGLADPQGELASPSSPGTTELAGTIEIFALTPDCVIGEIRDMPVPRYGRVVDGGFVAQVCTRVCVPLAGQSCWP